MKKDRNGYKYTFSQQICHGLCYIKKYIYIVFDSVGMPAILKGREM